MVKAMANMHRSLALEPEHCRAIADEIGERLHYSLQNQSPAPPSLSRLLNRLNEVELGLASPLPHQKKDPT